MNENEIKILRDAMGILGSLGDKTYRALVYDGCKPNETARQIFLIVQSELNK